MGHVDRRILRNIGRCVLLASLLATAACSHRLSAAQIAVLKTQGFQPKDDNWELGLSDKMLFDVNSDVLKGPTRQSIEHTGGALGAVGIRSIRVEGHTDNTGSDELNLDLSKRRAAAVAQALNMLKLERPVGVVGRGKANPIADNATEAGRAENRRVAVIVPSEQD